MEALDSLRDRVLGFSFPGGVVEIPPHQRHLSHLAARAPVLPPGLLHPMWVMVGGLRGMGVTIADLIRLMGSSEDAGVVFGEATIEQEEALHCGQEYQVTGRCTDVRRHAGRRSGSFDVLSFELDLSHDGLRRARSTNSFIFFRSGE